MLSQMPSWVKGPTSTIATMLSYTITSIGVLLSLSTLGMSWRGPWLVAALSLGIGFGLQEITTTSSRLVVLFERPVRIGAM